MNQSIKKVIEIGINQETDSWLAGKIKLVNIISLVNFIFILNMIIIDFFINKTHYLSIVLLFVSFVMLLPYYLNYKKRYIASRIAFLIFAYISICFLAIVFGKEFYFQYYLVPGVGMSLIFFRDEIGKKKWIFTFAGIPLWIFLEIWFFYNPALVILDGKYVSIISYFSSFLIFATAIVMFGVFTHESDKQLINISRMNKKFKQLANVDALTGLYNRRFIDEQMDLIFKTAKEDKSFLSLVIFDIDFFKKVNDTFGHDAGDKVLQMIAKLANENFRQTDLVGRIGGEEFCIIFTNTNKENVLKIVDRFRKTIEEQTVVYEQKNIKITSSFGISYLSQKIDSYTDLFKNADEALYKAKKDGRNRICEYEKK
ncbi:GGDEF domain-containing protein [Arcobacter sp. L]|uniref:GGDEF domain-containing protein n=1 Tax=Arcobacter sp. L TaxID=944547 RepID=UPI00022961C9|nr:GGDEF domain-containing protein [Arcobacter sp. L]BAK73561.1 diguanylate cyclase [Arcobacter sp. L]